MKNKMLILVVLLCIPLTSWAEVTMRIAWELNGPFSELQAVIKEGKALQKKINPKVRHELWGNVVHGANVSSASLLVYYDDFEHYAQARARQFASEEWGEYISRFPADKFPTTYVGLNRTLIGEGRTTAKGGETLAIIAFDAIGSVEDLVGLVNEAAKIQSKVNPKASIGLSVSQVSGENVGGMVVLVRYPSMVDWAQGIAKLEASEAWGEFLANFPEDKYPIVYQGLSQAGSID